MHADDVIVRELPDTAAIVIRDVNFLVPATRGDERDLAAGNPLISGQRFDNIIGEAMRGLTRGSAVTFRQTVPPP